MFICYQLVIPFVSSVNYSDQIVQYSGFLE
jgi:hypothetical protein